MSKLDLFNKVAAPEALKEDRGVALKACCLCGGEEAQRLYMQAHFPVVRCRKCGLVYADEHFQKADLDAFYTGDYYQRAYVCHPKEIDGKIANDYVRAFQRVDRSLKKGRLLDFGSARGTFLRALKERGMADRWEVEGIDINPDEVQMGLDAGTKVTCGTLESVGYERHRFDAVTAFSVLEHLQQPLDVLRQIHEVLRPGGEFLLVVPSGACLIIKLAVLASKVLGDRVRGFTDNVFHEEHLYYFSAKTMAQVLRKSGFEPKQTFFLPSYLETHPPSLGVAAGAYALRFASFALRQQTMLGMVAKRV